MAQTFEKEMIIFALLPHMHFRGKAARWKAIYPDGSEEELLDVPKYDFMWQTNYTFKEPKRIPAGTRIEAAFWFDNSSERAEIAAEVDPSKEIIFGPRSTDEMDLAIVTYADLDPENLHIEGVGGAGQ
jgi:hypothetical protein